MSARLYGSSSEFCCSAISADVVDAVSPAEQEAIIKASEVIINLCFMCIPSMTPHLNRAHHTSHFFDGLFVLWALDNTDSQFATFIRGGKFLASNDSEYLNKQAILDIGDKLLALAASIKESVHADSSPVEVVTATGTLLNCGRLMLEHYGNLIHEEPEDRKFPIGFTRG